MANINVSSIVVQRLQRPLELTQTTVVPSCDPPPPIGSMTLMEMLITMLFTNSSKIGMTSTDLFTGSQMTDPETTFDEVITAIQKGMRAGIFLASPDPNALPYCDPLNLRYVLNHKMDNLAANRNAVAFILLLAGCPRSSTFRRMIKQNVNCSVTCCQTCSD